MEVYTAKYGPLAGHDIAASGIQWCGGDRHDADAVHGLMLWDVTNATKPQQFGFLDTGCCTRGVHEFEVENLDDLDRTFAYASGSARGLCADIRCLGRRRIGRPLSAMQGPCGHRKRKIKTCECPVAGDSDLDAVRRPR